MPALVWGLYMLETAHYLHCLYAVLYINAWSKDSWVLFFHHIVALLLISISYLTRTYRIGILVLYLHDICDVIMESCKVRYLPSHCIELNVVKCLGPYFTGYQLLFSLNNL